MIKHLLDLQCENVLVNDIDPAIIDRLPTGSKWSEKRIIYQTADVISLHIPLTNSTKNMIEKHELEQMQPETLIVNTSRGGIINETDL